MNALYEFKAEKSQEVTVPTETDDGILHKKETKTVSVPVLIKKPNRRELEDVDMIYATHLSECLKKGILSKTMLATVYANFGGSLSEEEKSKYSSLYEEFARAQMSLKILQMVDPKDEEKDLSDEEKEDRKEVREKAIEEATKKLWEVIMEINDFENQQAQLFSQTAEVIARNKTLAWLVIKLTHIKEIDEYGEPKGDWKPFFKGEKFEDQLDYFDEITEGSDAFLQKVADKASVIVSFWYTGRAQSPEEIDYVVQSMEKMSESELSDG